MNRNIEHIGFVTQFSVNRLVGFLFPLLTNAPQSVELYINGKFCGRQIASKKSPLLEGQELEPNFQFDFDLRMIQTVYWDDEVRVVCQDRELAWTHQLLLKMYKRGLMARRPGQEKLFFFMHVPKTAGTSFRMMLYRQFQQDELWPNKEDLKNNRKHYPNVEGLRKLPMSKWQTVKLVMGHYKIGITREFIEKPIILTFLRNPQDHLISLAGHKQRQVPELSKMQLSDIVQDKILDNPQTRYLLPPHIHNKPITFELFELAKRNLDLCEFVGVQDRFNEGLDYLEMKYNWSLGRRIKKNVGGRHNHSVELTNIIKSRTQWDAELYKAAQIKFNALLSEINN